MQDNTYRLVPLTKGKYAKVSSEDYEAVAAWAWYFQSQGYAARTKRNKGGAKAGQKVIYMHRFIMDPPPELQIDHIDGDRLNNTRQNLRICTPSQNLQNAVSKRGKSKYKGVHQHSAFKRKRRWQATIMVHGRVLSFGYHMTEEEAARAYDVAARLHFKEFARTNFPEEGRLL
jgi:hypothetical protein